MALAPGRVARAGLGRGGLRPPPRGSPREKGARARLSKATEDKGEQSHRLDSNRPGCRQANLFRCRTARVARLTPGERTATLKPHKRDGQPGSKAGRRGTGSKRFKTPAQPCYASPDQQTRASQARSITRCPSSAADLSTGHGRSHQPRRCTPRHRDCEPARKRDRRSLRGAPELHSARKGCTRRARATVGVRRCSQSAAGTAAS